MPDCPPLWWGSARPSIARREPPCIGSTVGSSCPQALLFVNWEIILVPEVHDWFMALDESSASLVRDSIELLAERGPSLGRPAADRVTGSQLHNLKELRPGSAGRTEIRILFVFDPQRRAVLLVAGDKAGGWTRWYRDATAARDMRNARDVGYHLVQMRKQRGLTQAEVARAMGVSQARVSRMEHGDVDRMQVESIAAYVAAIGGHLRLVADFDQNTTTFIDYTDQLTA